MSIYRMGGVPTDADTLDGLNSTDFATPEAVAAAVAALVNSAPAALDTLNELAAALGDDPSFATTVTNAIAAKADTSALTGKVSTTDARLSDARTPTTHATSHATDGTDAITPGSIGAAAASHAHTAGDIMSGTISADRLPVGTTAGTVAAGDDPRLVAGQTPSAHAASHGSSGTDPVTPAAIGAATVANLTAHTSASSPHSGHENAAAKNTANGYAGLDATGKVASAQLPTIALANGGTGATTKTTAFNALTPQTTKGDLVLHSGTNAVRQGIGTNEQALVADSAQPNGVRWSNRSRYVTGSVAGVVSNTTATNPVWSLTIPAAVAATGSLIVIDFWGTTFNTTGANVSYTWQVDAPNGGTLSSAAISHPSNANGRNLVGRVAFWMIGNSVNGWHNWQVRLSNSAPTTTGLVSESGQATYPIVGTGGAVNADTTGALTFQLSVTLGTASVSAGVGYTYATATIIS